MAINKVIYGGETLIDLTSDTVTPENLLKGAYKSADFMRTSNSIIIYLPFPSNKCLKELPH